MSHMDACRLAYEAFQEDMLTSIDRQSTIKAVAHEPLPMNALQMVKDRLG